MITNILSESRKYRLNVILANLSLGQFDKQTEDAIFGNPGAVVSFRVGEEDAGLLAKHFGGGHMPGHFASLDNFTLCVKQHMFDEEIRRRAAARPRNNGRPSQGGGLALIGDLIQRHRWSPLTLPQASLY